MDGVPAPGVYYPQTNDLYVSFAVAGILYIIRQFYEKFVVAPFGAYFGLKHERTRRAPENDILENKYKKKKNPDIKEIEVLAKQTDMETRQIERWFRLRRNQDRPTLMKKFTETGWRFTFYFGIFVYGITSLWDKEWLWDSQKCWEGFPRHNVQSSIYWYYMIELGFYLSLMFSQFLDVKRKDFMEMFIHHIATVSLLSFSYVGNFIRVGTLVLCIHDCADFWVEGAKLAKYLKYHRMCDVLFAIFGLIWFVTRLICYPLKILYTTWYESNRILGFFPALVFFNGWLCLLLILHVYWFSLIVRVAHSALTKKAEVDDVRSSTEEPVTDADLDQNHHDNHVGNNVNHHTSNHVTGNCVANNVGDGDHVTKHHNNHVK